MQIFILVLQGQNIAPHLRTLPSLTCADLRTQLRTTMYASDITLAALQRVAQPIAVPATTYVPHTEYEDMAVPTATIDQEEEGGGT